MCLSSIDPGKDPLNAFVWTKQEEDFTDNAYNYDPTVDITVGPLYPYINSFMVYRCPSDTSVINHKTANGTVQLPRVRTVSMNFFFGFGGYGVGHPRKREGTLPGETTTPFILRPPT